MSEYQTKASNLPTDEFVRAYLECAEWCGVDSEDQDRFDSPCPCCGGSGEHVKRTAVDAYEFQFTCGRCNGDGEIADDDDSSCCHEHTEDHE